MKQFVKLQGFVNATEDFADHPSVINGLGLPGRGVWGPGHVSEPAICIEKIRAIMSIHARTSIGVASLPNNITVEIEAIVEILPEGKSHG